MKSILIVILSMCALLSSCLTNPYTEEDYEKGKIPADPQTTIMTGILPGLPQIIHGEYAEGIVLGYFFYVYAGMYITDPGMGAKQLGVMGVLAVFTISVIDGAVSASKRCEQYEYFRNQAESADSEELASTLLY